MLSTFSNKESFVSSSLLLSSSSPIGKMSNVPRKISDCRTNTSSSFSSGSNNHSFSDYDPIINLSNNTLLFERILQEIFESQTIISFDDISSFANDNNLYFKSRISIFQWIEEVLNSSSLALENKNSIYHRFAYGYLITTYLLTKQKIFYTNTHFKVFIVALFLLCYKLEGLTVRKLIINTMIKTFLTSVNIIECDLAMMIREMEIIIFEMLNYDLCVLENNLQQISQLLFHMISSTVLLCNEDIIETVSFYLEQINSEIENAKDIDLLFKLQPIEKGLVSLVSALLVSEPNTVKSCIEYFYSEFNVIRVSKETILHYSEEYAQKVNRDD